MIQKRSTSAFTLHRRQRGDYAERLVAKRFSAQGYVPLARSFFVGRTEWDWVFWRKTECLAIEVRARTFAPASDFQRFFPWSKRQRLWRSAPQLGAALRRCMPAMAFCTARVALAQVVCAPAWIRLRVYENVDVVCETLDH